MSPFGGAAPVTVQPGPPLCKAPSGLIDTPSPKRRAARVIPGGLLFAQKQTPARSGRGRAA